MNSRIIPSQRNNSIKLTAILILTFTTLITQQAFAQQTNQQTLTPETVKQILAGNALLIMRHAIAPGTGDPDNFSVDDCTTQRNLSDTGRQQAKTIGDTLRQSGITQATVYTSAWCRCQETARLLGYDSPQVLPSLNSFFQNFDQREPQTTALRKFTQTSLGLPRPDKPVILVTHQVNITALTNVYPESGEVLVITIDPQQQITVVDQFTTP